MSSGVFFQKVKSKGGNVTNANEEKLESKACLLRPFFFFASHAHWVHEFINIHSNSFAQVTQIPKDTCPNVHISVVLPL